MLVRWPVTSRVILAAMSARRHPSGIRRGGLEETHHRKAGEVVRGVEQVFPVRRREQQMFLRIFHSAIQSYIFAGSIHANIAGNGNALKKGRLAIELMRELAFPGHSRGVGARCLGQSRIPLKWRHSDLRPSLIGKLEQFALRVVVVTWSGAVAGNRVCRTRRPGNGLLKSSFGGNGSGRRQQDSERSYQDP